jgi:hypothetical protein
MQDEHELNPGDCELEAALRTLTPAAVPIDAVSTAFEAGRRSARRQVYIWRSAAAAMLLMSAGVWMIPAFGSRFVPREVGIENLVTQPSQPLHIQSVAMLERSVREGGISTLPPTPLPDVGKMRAADLL